MKNNYLIITDTKTVAFNGKWYKQLTDIVLPKSKDPLYTTVYYYGCQVAFFKLALPKMKASERRDAIAYGLEDILGDSIEKLHFTKVRTHKDHNIDVGVVARHFLDTQLQLLTSCHFLIQAWISVGYLLPEPESGIQVFLDQDVVIIREKEEPVVTLQRDNWLTFLQNRLIFYTNASLGQVPITIEGVLNDAEQLSLKPYQLTHKSAIPLLDRIENKVKLSQLKQVNLLHTTYRQKRPRFYLNWQELWHKSGFRLSIFIGFLLLISCSAGVGHYANLKRQASDLTLQVKQLDQQILTHNQNQHIDKATLTKRLQRLSRIAKANQGLQILISIAPFIMIEPRLHLSALTLTSHHLSLQFKAARTQLNILLHKLKSKNLSISIQSHTQGIYQVIVSHSR